MRQFIIGEDVLGAIAQCIGAATHQVPYGQVAGLIQRLETLQQVQGGPDGRAESAEGVDKPDGTGGKRKRAGKAPAAAPAEASQAA